MVSTLSKGKKENTGVKIFRAGPAPHDSNPPHSLIASAVPVGEEIRFNIFYIILPIHCSQKVPNTQANTFRQVLKNKYCSTSVKENFLR